MNQLALLPDAVPAPAPVIRFTVFGVAQPAGSKQAFVPQHPRTKEPYRNKHGRIVVNVIDDNPKGKAWKKRVAQAARAAYRGPLLTGPVRVRFLFLLPRPQGHFGTGRNAGFVRGSAPKWMTTRPDVLKLARAIEDALTGIIWLDDAQIVSEELNKGYADVIGASVTIEIEELL